MTFSAFVAYFVCTNGEVSLKVFAMAGIFLLAAGASVLNQYQERNLDERMERTHNRPLAAKLIPPISALIIAILLIVTGLALLAWLKCWTCLYLGVFNIAWYNGFYTWLKRKTPFAVVPGALTGVIPVWMGWEAAGGSFFDPVAMMLALFLFLWQVPHFWLLMIRYSEDYRKAGLPVVTDVFTPRQIRTVTFSWMIAAALASLLLLRFRIFLDLYSSFAVLFLSVTLVLLTINQFFISKANNFRLLFISVNIYLLLILAVLAIERI